MPDFVPTTVHDLYARIWYRIAPGQHRPRSTPSDLIKSCPASTSSILKTLRLVPLVSKQAGSTSPLPSGASAWSDSTSKWSFFESSSSFR